MTDYPAPIARINHIEPVPRRIRAFLGRRGRARHHRRPLRLGVAAYPQYYIPLADVDAGAARRRAARRTPSRGTVELSRPRVGEVHRPRAARCCGESPIAGTSQRHRAVRVGRARRLVRGGRAGLRPSPQSLHPGRRPALDPDGPRRAGGGRCWPSRSSPVMVFETGLPTRYYLNRTEVDFDHLGPHRHRHRLPVQGDDHAATGRVPIGDTTHTRPGLGLRLPHPPAAPHRRPGRLLQREGRHLPRRRAAGAAENNIELT